MVYNVYLDLLILDFWIYYSYCAMDISNLLIHVIVIMRIYLFLHIFDMRREIYPFEHKKLVDLLFIFPDESAMDVQRRSAFNGVY